MKLHIYWSSIILKSIKIQNQTCAKDSENIIDSVF